MATTYCIENADKKIQIIRADVKDNRVSIAWRWPEDIELCVLFSLKKDMQLRELIDEAGHLKQGYRATIVSREAKNNYSIEIGSDAELYKIYAVRRENVNGNSVIHIIDQETEQGNDNSPQNVTPLFYRQKVVGYRISYPAKNFFGKYKDDFITICFDNSEEINEEVLYFKYDSDEKVYPIDMEFWKEGLIRIPMRGNQKVQVCVNEIQNKYITLKNMEG